MRYADFIGELKNLVGQAQELRRTGATHEDSDFREWRHRAESLVEEARLLGYRLPGNFASFRRAYRATWPRAPSAEDGAALAADLGDSIIELRFLIDQYERYGVPPVVPHKDSVSQMAPPERATLAWLFRNVPVTLWISGFSLDIAAFGFGAAVGGAAAYTKLSALIKSLFGS